MTLDKTYDPAAAEAKFYERWEKSGAFKADPHSSKIPYTLMMPPPNVTGNLHIGHALTFTIQDILVRYARMKNKDVLWQPGTDHAGISTQLVVERQLAAEKIRRRDIGRAAFLEKVWAWKEQSGGTITRQLRRLGASCDWSRERFTMDEGLSTAVRRVFVKLYHEKLIYKDKRLVNWDPKMQTAVSDLEVEAIEIKGHMWYFKYQIDGTDEYVTIATTRPDTLPSDVAVAVHPEDERYRRLIGKMIKHPIRGILIPIIADEIADMTKGTGALKISPAHDFKDFEVGKRHKLPLINIFDPQAKLNNEVPEKYRGLDRFEARKLIVADMEEMGLLEKVESHVHAVPHDEKTKTIVIEPYLSEQWYCDAQTLAKPALEAVEKGETKFVPEQWTNTYYAWMRNIEPWCISRQLWWGHQIPAWYGPDNTIFVAENDHEASLQAMKHYGQKTELRRDEDVLDTWFSSALWPFSTLGWPEATPEITRYYPTDVLVTGFDIIFFWVARMMMMGMHFMKEVPFKTVYIHALVRDEKGQKMSKVKGNVVDPLDVIEKYGCDALRFTMASMSTPGRDIRLAMSRIEGNRNFATKLWNAARFCQMNACILRTDFNPSSVSQIVNKWIVGETKSAVDKIAKALDEHRFDLASSAAYEFTWNSFCDWYLEFTKPILLGDDASAKEEVRSTTAWVLKHILHALHPFMPFITEELWHEFTGSDALLISSHWPDLHAIKEDQAAREEMNWLVRVATAIRTVRAELNVPAGAQIPLHIKDAGPHTQRRIKEHEAIIQKLARLSSLTHVNALPKGSAQIIVDEATLILPLAEIVDLDQERTRLQKESEKWAAEIRKIDAKLANQDFVDRAPPEVVEEHRERRAEAEATIAKLEAARESLAG